MFGKKWQNKMFCTGIVANVVLSIKAKPPPGFISYWLLPSFSGFPQPVLMASTRVHLMRSNHGLTTIRNFTRVAQVPVAPTRSVAPVAVF